MANFSSISDQILMKFPFIVFKNSIKLLIIQTENLPEIFFIKLEQLKVLSLMRNRINGHAKIL